MGFVGCFASTNTSPHLQIKNLPRKQKKQWQSYPPQKKTKKKHLPPPVSWGLLDFNVWNVDTYPPTYHLHPQKNWPSSSADLKATRRCCHGVLVGVDGPTKVGEKQRKATKRAKQSTRFPKEDFAMAFFGWKKVGKGTDLMFVEKGFLLLLLKRICLDKNGEMYDNKDFSIWIDV